MLDYYFYMLRSKKLNPKKGCALFNKYKLKNPAKLLTRSGIQLAEKVSIVKPFTFTDGNLDIGHSVYINTGCFFLDMGNIKIGNNTLIGPYCQFYTVTHEVHPEKRIINSEGLVKDITIGNNVWVGGGVIICPGVTIGDNSVIAAGSVVTKNVPTNSMYAGNPAVLKKVFN